MVVGSVLVLAPRLPNLDLPQGIWLGLFWTVGAPQVVRSSVVCDCTLYLHLLQHSIYKERGVARPASSSYLPLLSRCGHVQGTVPALHASYRVLVYVQWALCFHDRCVYVAWMIFSRSTLYGN